MLFTISLLDHEFWNAEALGCEFDAWHSVQVWRCDERLYRCSSFSTALCPPLLQIHRADFTCPSWFSVGVKAVLRKLLDPNPKTVSGSPLMLKTI